MRRLHLLTTLCAAFSFFFYCPDSQNVEETPPLKIGAIYNLSGAQAGLDIPSSQGALLAVQETNSNGGLLGQEVRLVLEDGETDTMVIAAKTAQILEESPSVVALMGLSDTDMVLAAAPVAAQKRRLFLTSGATSPQLPAQVPKYLFLACFGDNVQAAAGAEWAYNELSVRTVSVLFNATEIYTRLLHEYFEARFSQLGGQVLAVESYTGLADIGPSIESLPHADLVFLSAWPDEAPQAVALLRQAGSTSPILGGDSFDSIDLWEQQPEVRDVFFTTHAYLGSDNGNPRVQAFRDKYVAAYPDSRPDAFAALGYDTARLLIAAIDRAKSLDPDEVRKALSETREFSGVTGTISYLNGSRIPTKSVSIIEIDQGSFRLRQELSPAEVPTPNSF